MASTAHPPTPLMPPRSARLLAPAAVALMLSACAGASGPDPAEAEAAAFAGCPGARLGCATERNIAMAVARPADLSRPRRPGPRDPMRRDAMLAEYAERPPADGNGKMPGLARLNGGTR